MNGVICKFDKHLTSTFQGSPHVQASILARYAKIFGWYTAEIADMHLFFTRYAPFFNTFIVRSKNGLVMAMSQF